MEEATLLVIGNFSKQTDRKLPHKSFDFFAIHALKKSCWLGITFGLVNIYSFCFQAQRDSFEVIMEQLDSVVLGVLSDMVAGEDPVTLDLGEVAVVAAKVTSDGLKDMQMGTGDAGVAMPPGDEIAKLAGESPINVMVITEHKLSVRTVYTCYIRCTQITNWASVLQLLLRYTYSLSGRQTHDVITH